MRTELLAQYKNTPQGQEADSILRSCVHCGFCTATCPTYQLLGDELDGPRGRIYLIKQVLEGQAVTTKTQLHLDRCLTCRSCETTCPSGVQYGRLVDIGREIVDHAVPRPIHQRALRLALRKLIAYPKRFAFLLRAGQMLRPLLPRALRRKVPTRQTAATRSSSGATRFVIALDGCAQSAATPNTNAAAAKVLAQLGIDFVSAPQAGCCGALSHHLSAEDEARDFMRRNIDAWWPLIEKGAEAIVITASGCGVVVKEYGHLLANDSIYRGKAAAISAMTVDIAEYLDKQDLASLRPRHTGRRVAFHAPCTLQHGQQVIGVVERILTKAGYTLTRVPDGHLCCGSAGTYSILQSALSQHLLQRKLVALEGDSPDVIATANVGCQLHLASGAKHAVRHWIELLADNP